jgi:nicotinamide-nucleotide amidase
VSEAIAKQMAIRIGELFCSSYGIGITGYASPLPEKNIRQLFAFYAIAHDGKICSDGKLYTSKTSAYDAQNDYALQLLKILVDCF